MSERVHGEAAVTGPDLGAAKHAASPVCEQTVRHGSVEEVAALVRAQPALQQGIFESLHQQRGNAFVQQVVAAASSAHAHSHAGEESHDLEDGDDDPVKHAKGRLDRFGGDVELDQVFAGGKVLQKGDKGPAVRKVQVALRDLGLEVNLHALFDDRMVTAVNKLRTKAGLKATGEVDRAAFGALEDRLRSRAAYAEAAKETKPNHYQFETPDPDHPPSAILRHTHTLSNDEKAEANKALGPDRDKIAPFDPATGEKYKGRLDALLREKIAASAVSARKHNAAHADSDNLYSTSQVVDIGNRAKQVTDRVFGSFKIGDDFKGGVNLHDKFTAEQRDITKGGDKAKATKARNRVDKIVNSDDAVERLNREFSVDPDRDVERDLIKTVRDKVADDMQDDLIQIMLDWSASAGDDGVRISFRNRGDDHAANRERLWSMFGTLVHEYVHTLQHPAWVTWRAAKSKESPEAGSTLREGVTELLTRSVLAVTALTDTKLRKDVEGEYYDDSAKPELDRSGKYATETTRAEQLAGVVGIHNIFGAYFVGRTKLVGGE